MFVWAWWLTMTRPAYFTFFEDICRFSKLWHRTRVSGCNTILQISRNSLLLLPPLVSLMSTLQWYGRALKHSEVLTEFFGELKWVISTEVKYESSDASSAHKGSKEGRGIAGLHSDRVGEGLIGKLGLVSTASGCLIYRWASLKKTRVALKPAANTKARLWSGVAHSVSYPVNNLTFIHICFVFSVRTLSASCALKPPHASPYTLKTKLLLSHNRTEAKKTNKHNNARFYCTRSCPKGSKFKCQYFTALQEKRGGDSSA